MCDLGVLASLGFMRRPQCGRLALVLCAARRPALLTRGARGLVAQAVCVDWGLAVPQWAQDRTPGPVLCLSSVAAKPGGVALRVWVDFGGGGSWQAPRMEGKVLQAEPTPPFPRPPALLVIHPARLRPDMGWGPMLGGLAGEEAGPSV